MAWGKQSEIVSERLRFERDMQRIRNSYVETDKEFEEWKEGVLTFEHSEHSADGDSGDDDWVCNGESVWPAEDENDIQ